VVGEARNGKEALNLIEMTKPDVAILDIKMPHLNGIDLAQKLAGRYPIIMLTAYSERHLIEQARDAGVMAYLTKPFREENLAPAIELSVRHFSEKSTLADRVLRLKDELETRKIVDRAKGLLMESDHLSEAQAYRKIQKISMDKNKSLREVAEAIITMLG
jgi:two-component system, response regulator PdtaR